MSSFDWAGLQTSLRSAFAGAVERFARAHPEVRLRAVALHGFSGQFDRSLSLPALAVALESDGFADRGTLFSERFGPADWRHAELEVDGASALERAVTAEATRADRAHFAATEKAFTEALLEAVRHLATQVPTRVPTTPDFIAYWFSNAGLEMVRQTVPAPLVERFFPKDLARLCLRERMAAAPVEERLTFFAAHLHANDEFSWEEAQAGLVAAGDDAFPTLLGLLSNARDVAAAAMVVARLGRANVALVEALRQRDEGLWPAMALGRLGDFDWLLRRPVRTAVLGFTAPYKAITQGPRRVPLDYRPLERLLETVPDAAPLVEKELAPGRSRVHAGRGDEAELARGFGSRHRVVRWHAVSLAGWRDLDPAVLPALADRLGDVDATVRRLTVLSLRQWKAAAEPYEARIAALANDDDALVRRIEPLEEQVDKLERKSS
ncbi:MAG: hypothetical protein SFW67_20875 [Myxococcaceae bacterium]|nr:hypothetical protein [Myxococcaceae bacterium]